MYVNWAISAYNVLAQVKILNVIRSSSIKRV